MWVVWCARSVCAEGPELQQLLLDIYRQIDDPDAIYSVLQGADAATQLCRHEHEGSWGRVLEGCDQMLRVGGGGGGSGGGASALSRVSFGAHLAEPHQAPPGQSQHEAPQLQVQLKLLHALQNLGCLHVAQVRSSCSTCGLEMGFEGPLGRQHMLSSRAVSVVKPAGRA